MNIRGALALFLALQLAGCSIFLPSPASAPATEDLNCAARGVPPVLDTLMATAGLVGGTVVIVADQSSSCSPDAEFCFKGLPTLIIGLPALLLGALYTLSAVHGWHRNAECQEHNAMLARARDPDGGAIGSYCVVGSDVFGCQPGLTCTFDRCVRDDATTRRGVTP